MHSWNRPFLPNAHAVITAVTASEAAKEHQTPSSPNILDKRMENTAIATNPLLMDARNDVFAFPVALRYPVPTILKPATKNPKTYMRSPVCAYSAISKDCSLLNNAIL